MKTISCLILFALVIASCKKENSGYDPNFRGGLKLDFDNVVGAGDLQLNTGTYTNAAGETFSVRALQYFISNISLLNTDGSVYTVPQDSSYFLIEESSVVSSSPVLKIPEGEYKELRFIIGVDSLRSTRDLSERTGALTPTITTYFNENEGYIFFNMEGNSPQAPDNRYQFHIGGYGGKTSSTFNNIKQITLDLSAKGISRIREGQQSIVEVKADIAKVFTGLQNISLAENNIILFEPFSVNVADNYALMFTHNSTLN
jgi:hypothetical protein